MRAIIYTPNSWNRVWSQIREDYSQNIIIPSVLKRKLGFTVREHRYWVPKMDGGYYDFKIHLDFYEEKMKTLYLLKYGHFEKLEAADQLY
jgi:hypothetical protein